MARARSAPELTAGVGWLLNSFMVIIGPKVAHEIQGAVERVGRRIQCVLSGLPGCWSQGATEEAALANIQDAIAEYLRSR